MKREAAGVEVLVLADVDMPSGDDWLDEEERSTLEGLHVPKRRDEWLLGRWTAKRAVGESLGIAPEVVSIHPAPSGAPEALVHGHPAPCAVSITHRAGLAACAVGPPDLALGCDLELVEPRSDGFVEEFLTEREARFVGAAPDRDLAANLVWSAKEAVLKARRTGLRADARSVEVSPSKARPGGAWAPFVCIDEESEGWRGWWARREDHVLTVVSRPATPAPTELEVARSSLVRAESDRAPSDRSS